MHRALAEVLAGHPDRQVWHRAAASVGSDEEVAAGLEAAAGRAFGRGAIAEQAAALAAAARLSPGSARRGQRLLRAAWAFYELGRVQTTLRLLDEAEPLDLKPGDRLRLAWARETFGAATRSGARPLTALAEVADQMRQDGDIGQALLVLVNVALRCFWSNPDRRTRQRMTTIAEAVSVAGGDPRLLFVLALCDPVGHGAAVLARLARHQPGSGTAHEDYHLGYAAGAVGACEQAVGFLTAAARPGCGPAAGWACSATCCSSRGGRRCCSGRRAWPDPPATKPPGCWPKAAGRCGRPAHGSSRRCWPAGAATPPVGGEHHHARQQHR
jgi:hypothetical protein